MIQCEKCIHENAPCFAPARESAEKNACGWYENAQPWLEKWIVPDGYEILAEKGAYYYGLGPITRGQVRWGKNTGRTYNHLVPDLIPRKPPIEETPEYKAFADTYKNQARHNQIKEKFEEISKLFTLTLKTDGEIPQQKNLKRE